MAEEAKKTVKPEKEEMIRIKLPREEGKGDLFVSVNERTWLIKRGINVEVPLCVAEVLDHADYEAERVSKKEAENDKILDELNKR